MRASATLLDRTAVRLSELEFPSNRLHVPRTRLAFIHLDNLLHFAKMDRDGRVDGFVAAYLPDEVAILLLNHGEVMNAIAMAGDGRRVMPIATALKDMREQIERGELVYADAPMEQLAWMYQSCALPATPRQVDGQRPEALFTDLRGERFSGVLELISNGRVAYFKFDGGQYASGYFTGRPDGRSVPKYVEGLFSAGADGKRPQVAAAVFPAVDRVPAQAPPALIQTYRELFWHLAEVAEGKVPGEAMKRAYRLRDGLEAKHAVLSAIGRPLDREALAVVTSAEGLTDGLAAWVSNLLQELEIIAPGIAPGVLREATREDRFVLQKSEFYGKLPWPVTW